MAYSRTHARLPSALARRNPVTRAGARRACRAGTGAAGAGRVTALRRSSAAAAAAASRPTTTTTTTGLGVRCSAAADDDVAVEVAADTGDSVCDPLCSVNPPDEDPSVSANYSAQEDLLRATLVGGGLVVGGLGLGHDWVAANESAALCAVFLLGYAGIIFEEAVAFNKSGVALLTAVGMWTVRSFGGGDVAADLDESLADVSEIVFFLMGAMTIVETVDAHQGFKIVTDSIKTRDRSQLLWLIGGITFFMSAILDNLTSTIVMVSLLRKLIDDEEDRKFFGAVVVIAANAGGAWTPIGDVTTTMLWINGQITTVATMKDLILPSMVSLLVPLALLTALDDGPPREVRAPDEGKGGSQLMAPRGNLVFGAGVASLVFVPVFKQLTGLPPWMGMLFGLGSLWLLTDAIHFGEDDRDRLKVPNALTKIDTQGVLFFLGILMAISALDTSGVLKDVAVWLNETIGNTELIATAIGIASAVIDNVPLVAATMGMYDLSAFPQDSELWQLIAYCAGTGGSILIIGSAAGVAFMGMEKAEFMWYTRRVSPLALAGYLGGIGTYLALNQSGVGNLLAMGQLPLPGVTH